MSQTSSPYMTVGEAASEFRVDCSTIRRWIRKGALMADQPGRDYRIHRSARDLFVRARRTPVTRQTRGITEADFERTRRMAVAAG